MTATRIPIYSTAFSLSHGKKRPQNKNKDYLGWLHTLPCVISGRSPIQAAHLRIGSLPHGKPHSGAGGKPDDLWCLPLHEELHREQHHCGDEMKFWSAHGIDDPFALCALLFVAFTRNDDEAAWLVVKNARETCGRNTFQRPSKNGAEA